MTPIPRHPDIALPERFSRCAGQNRGRAVYFCTGCRTYHPAENDGPPTNHRCIDFDLCRVPLKR